MLPCKPCSCGFSLPPGQRRSRSPTLGQRCCKSRETFTRVLRGTLGTEIAAGVKGSWEQHPSPAWPVPRHHSCGSGGPFSPASSNIPEKVVINVAITDGGPCCAPPVCPILPLHSLLSQGCWDQGVSFPSAEHSWIMGEGGVLMGSRVQQINRHFGC